MESNLSSTETPPGVSTEATGFWSIERVVAVLTPVFAALAGVLTGWLGNHFPGHPALNSTDVLALEITGFTGAAAAALKWLHGRQKFMQVTDDIDKVIDNVVAKLQQSAAWPTAQTVENLLLRERQEIVSAVSREVGASPKVEEIAQEVVQGLVGARSGAAAGAGGAAPVQ